MQVKTVQCRRSFHLTLLRPFGLINWYWTTLKHIKGHSVPRISQGQNNNWILNLVCKSFPGLPEILLSIIYYRRYIVVDSQEINVGLPNIIGSLMLCISLRRIKFFMIFTNPKQILWRSQTILYPVEMVSSISIRPIRAKGSFWRISRQKLYFKLVNQQSQNILLE